MYIANYPITFGAIYNSFTEVYNSEQSNIINNFCVDDIKDFIPKLVMKRSTYRQQNDTDHRENLLPVDLVINHSAKRVVAKNHSNVPMIIENKDNIVDNFIYIMTLYTFKNPYATFDPTVPISKYGSKLIKRYSGSNDVINKEILEIIRVLHEYGGKIADINNMISDNQHYATIVMYTKISEKELQDKGTVFVRNKNILLSYKDIELCEDHPSVSNDNPFVTKELINTTKDNQITFVLVDNHNKLSDKYIKILNNTIRIPKIVDHTRPDGLYSFVRFGQEQKKYYMSFEDLEKDKVIFSSEEEANNYTDSNKINDIKLAEIRAKEIELSNEAIALKTKMAQDNAEHQKQMNELKLKYEEETSEIKKKMNEMSIEHEKQINDIKIKKEQEMLEKEKELSALRNDGERLKHQYNEKAYQREDYYEGRKYRLKDSYDEGKYMRDATVETIKTVATILSLVGTVYLLTKKS